MKICIKTIVIVFTFLIGCACRGLALSFDDDCPAPRPCTCSGLQVNCRNASFTDVPPLNKPSEKTKHYLWQIDLSYNNITTIKSRAFENLTVYRLYIHNNNIKSMDDDALIGSEKSMRAINIQDNKFTELPVAIGTLQKLNMFSVQYNPMRLLREDILRNISKTLEWLDMGSKEMIAWPTEIKVLTKLISLAIYDTPIEVLPNNAFEGFENSLIFLEFTGTKLKEIPVGLRNLKLLSSLSFEDNIYLTEAGFYENSFDGMNLSDIYISNSSFNEVPDFSSLKNLQYLNVKNSNISKWDPRKLPREPILEAVSLDFTAFTEVPDIISTIPTLSSVSLAHTKINAVTDGDFTGLFRLESLDLSNCPIKNISRNAFRDNFSMLDLYLDNTNISIIPRTIEHLTGLRGVYLTGDNIQCTCASMGWMKSWNHTRHVWGVTGTCNNLQDTSIMTFITRNLPNCPNNKTL